MPDIPERPHRYEVFLAEDGQKSIRVVMWTQDEVDSLVAENARLRAQESGKQDGGAEAENTRQRIRELRWVAERALRYISTYQPSAALGADLANAIANTPEFDIRDAALPDA